MQQAAQQGSNGMLRDMIVWVSAQSYGITVKDLRAPHTKVNKQLLGTRTAKGIIARQLAVYLLRQDNTPYAKIAALLGYANHTRPVKAMASFEVIAQVDTEVQRHIRITNRLINLVKKIQHEC